jgi:hypothetical protein
MCPLCAAKERNKTYCVYREVYRVKINPDHQGKKRGPGKSTVSMRVLSHGAAEKILSLVQEKRELLTSSSEYSAWWPQLIKRLLKPCF